MPAVLRVLERFRILARRYRRFQVEVAEFRLVGHAGLFERLFTFEVIFVRRRLGSRQQAVDLDLRVAQHPAVLPEITIEQPKEQLTAVTPQRPDADAEDAEKRRHADEAEQIVNQSKQRQNAVEETQHAENPLKSSCSGEL